MSRSYSEEHDVTRTGNRVAIDEINAVTREVLRMRIMPRDEWAKNERLT